MAFLLQAWSMKIYFVTAGRMDETKVIKELRPKNILLSYFYFNKRAKIERLLERIGYRPNILFDSGAYSAMTQGKDISLTAYIRFVKDNNDLLDEIIQLDVFEKEFITKSYYDIMKSEGLDPIPVFHYGFNENLMQYFIDQGAKRIALGGTVGISSKTKVAEWAKLFCWLYPAIDFHLLGSSSLKILDHCDIDSVDASTWLMMAINGQPSHLKSKLERMKYHMAKLIKYEEEAN